MTGRGKEGKSVGKEESRCFVTTSRESSSLARRGGVKRISGDKAMYAPVLFFGKMPPVLKIRVPREFLATVIKKYHRWMEQ